jgi:hypothetical protein
LRPKAPASTAKTSTYSDRLHKTQPHRFTCIHITHDSLFPHLIFINKFIVLPKQSFSISSKLRVTPLFLQITLLKDEFFDTTS